MAWASKLLFEINLLIRVLIIKQANCLTGKFKQAGKELRNGISIPLSTSLTSH